jgi:hypothetical protein
VGDEQLRVDEFCLFLVSWLTSSVTPPQSGLSCDNLDGREFIRRLRREGIDPGDAMKDIGNSPSSLSCIPEHFVAMRKITEEKG